MLYATGEKSKKSLKIETSILESDKKVVKLILDQMNKM